MSRIRKVTRGSLSIILLITALACPALARKDDVIIVPARPHIMALAFDVHKLRSMALVSYRGNASSTNPLLHVWNDRLGIWQEISVDELSFINMQGAKTGRLFLLGAEKDVPGVIMDVAAQARRLYRIESLGTAEAANAFHQQLRFSPREWNALAQRHGFQTEDLNYEQRRWGRFGPPGTRLLPPSPANQTGQTDITGLEQEIDSIEIQETPLDSSDTTASQENDFQEVTGAEMAEEEPAPPVFIPDPASHQPLEPEVMDDPPVRQEIIVPVVEEKGNSSQNGSALPESMPAFQMMDPADK